MLKRKKESVKEGRKKKYYPCMSPWLFKSVSVLAVKNHPWLFQSVSLLYTSTSSVVAPNCALAVKNHM